LPVPPQIGGATEKSYDPRLPYEGKGAGGHRLPKPGN